MPITRPGITVQYGSEAQWVGIYPTPQSQGNEDMLYAAWHAPLAGLRVRSKAPTDRLKALLPGATPHIGPAVGNNPSEQLNLYASPHQETLSGKLHARTST